jgi:hypothetical protein
MVALKGNFHPKTMAKEWGAGKVTADRFSPSVKRYAWAFSLNCMQKIFFGHTL